MRHPLEPWLNSPSAGNSRYGLPPAPPFLAGRGRELGLLMQTLPETPVTVICGPPGVGKSALAVRAAHLAGGLFPDGPLYVNLRGSQLRNVRPADGKGETAALLCAAAAGRRVLVVLDNVTSLAQISPMVAFGPGSAVIITTRHDLTGLECARHVRLGALSGEDVEPARAH